MIYTYCTQNKFSRFPSFLLQSYVHKPPLYPHCIEKIHFGYHHNNILLGDLDFSDEAVFVTFEADEGYTRPQYDSIAHINITDDDINEADQVFILHLELEYMHVNGDVSLDQRQSSLCRIIDDDRMF